MCEILRSDALGTCLRLLTINEILNVMCTMKFSFLQKELALTCILECMLKNIPEISLEAWRTALEDFEPNEYISAIKGVYSSFVLCEGVGIKKDWPTHIHQCLHDKEFCNQVDVEMLMFNGFFSSREARNALKNYADQRIEKFYAEDPTWLANQHQPVFISIDELITFRRAFKVYKLGFFEILKELAETSFTLQRMDTWDISPEHICKLTFPPDSESDDSNDDPRASSLKITMNVEDIKRLNEIYSKKPELENHYDFKTFKIKKSDK